MKILVLLVLLSFGSAFANTQVSHSCWTKTAPVTTRINYRVFLKETRTPELFQLWIHQNTAKVGKTWVADLSSAELAQMENSGRVETELQRIVRGVRRSENPATFILNKEDGVWRNGSISYRGFSQDLNFELTCDMVN